MAFKNIYLPLSRAYGRPVKYKHTSSLQSPCYSIFSRHQAPAFARNPEPSSGEQTQVSAPKGITNRTDHRPLSAHGPSPPPQGHALLCGCSQRRAEHGGGLPGGAHWARENTEGGTGQGTGQEGAGVALPT